VSDLVRIYGRGFSGLCWLLVLGWFLLLVLVPQVTMLDQSLWRLEQPKDAAQLSLDIDRLYNQLSVMKLDRQAAAGEKATALDANIAATEARLREMETREVRPRKVYGFDNYTRMSRLHFEIFIRTLLYSALTTLIALCVCYPIACAAAFAPKAATAAIILTALTVPYAINELLRIYAFLMVLDYRGVINTLLDWLGVIDLARDQSIPFLEHQGAVFAGLVYAYVLFMVFPIYNALESLDRSQIEAARDLGASSIRTHWRVIIPHAKPGLAVGATMVFMLSAGSYAVPRILSRGLGGDWFTQLIYRQFYEANNWNIGSAYAVGLLLACLAFVALVMRIARVGLRDMMR
jgi:spermidine/putrescine transport system permease protein